MTASRRILPIVLIFSLVAAAALLTANKRSPSRESLLPVLRTVQEHEKQADRVMGQVLAVSPDEERRIGQEMAARISAGAAAPARQGLLRELGRELSRAGPVRRFPGRYEFRALDRPGINAFAIAGGYVYVFDGLLRRFERDPDALLFVIAHEIGHVELGHCADAQRLGEWSRRFGLEPVGTAAGLMRLLAELHFSEIQELEADAFALRLIQAAGRDPAAALTAMDLLGLTDQADDRTKRDPGQVAVEGLADYFESHPGSWERRGRLKAEIERFSGPRRSARSRN